MRFFRRALVLRVILLYWHPPGVHRSAGPGHPSVWFELREVARRGCFSFSLSEMAAYSAMGGYGGYGTGGPGGFGMGGDDGSFGSPGASGGADRGGRMANRSTPY